VQDTRNVSRVVALDPALVAEQAHAVLADLPVAAVKLGLLANAAVGHAVAEVLRDHARVPLVVDPVLKASGGGVLAEEALLKVYLEELFPLATLITPNADEGRRLAPQAPDGPRRAEALLAGGAAYVLMKGADEATAEVHNTLYSAAGHATSTWPRLPGAYHGSGCTLASAAAALLAHGIEVSSAVQEAQRYTWEALKHAWPLGKGQPIPDRQRRL